jgi:hypothetical protein
VEELRADSADGVVPPIEDIILPPPDQATDEERAEVERATQRARNVSAQTRTEAALAAEALANAERVKKMAEQLTAEAEAAEARHQAAEAARAAELAKRAEPSTAGVIGGVLPTPRVMPTQPPPAQPSILVDPAASVEQFIAQTDTHFDEHEEDFFEKGSSPGFGHPAEPHDSFEDLDAGYQPVGFWDRLLGRDKPKGRPRKPTR